MRMLTGAVVLVAAAVVYAASVVADAIMGHRAGTRPSGIDWSLGLGMALGLIGLCILASGLRSEWGGPKGPPSA